MVLLAFSATFYKAQGTTLSKLVVDVHKELFAPGQLYVALSRGRRASDVLLLHKAEHGPLVLTLYNYMPMSVSNLVLRQAV